MAEKAVAGAVVVCVFWREKFLFVVWVAFLWRSLNQLQVDTKFDNI